MTLLTRNRHCFNIKFMISVFLLELAISHLCWATDYQTSLYIGGTTTHFSRIGQVSFVGQTDLLVPTNNNFHDFTLGIAAAIRKKPPTNLQNLIEEFSFGPEFFYFSTAARGDVWQYKLPEMNNLTFRIPVKSYRILATNEITFKPLIDKVNLLFVWGLGLAANDVAYHEYPRPTYNWPGISLAGDTQYHFSYTLGAGLKFDITDLTKKKTQQLQFSLRYLFAHLGSANVSSASNALVISPISVRLYTHTWVAGLTCLI